MAPLLGVLLGCTGDETNVVVEQSRSARDDTLAGTAWQVEDIDQAGIIDMSMVTIEFADEGRIAGSAGCNQYFGIVSYDDAIFSVSGLANTERACVPAIMEQERKFLDALQSAARFEVVDGMWLLLSDAAGNKRVKAIMTGSGTIMPPDEMPAVPADVAPDAATRFSCVDGPDIELHFLGPETVQLSMADGDHVLQRERTASGARYAGEGIDFWNKGAEAMLETPDGNYRCMRTEVER